MQIIGPDGLLVQGDLIVDGPVRFNRFVDIRRIGNQANVALRRANGSGNNPSKVLNNDSIGAFFFGGYDGTDWSVNTDGATVQATATEDWSPTAHGGRIHMAVTPNGTITAVESLRVTNSVVANDIRLQVFDVTAAALKTVTLGAADSGGAGFKVLRVPN